MLMFCSVHTFTTRCETEWGHQEHDHHFNRTMTSLWRTAASLPACCEVLVGLLLWHHLDPASCFLSGCLMQLYIYFPQKEKSHESPYSTLNMNIRAYDLTFSWQAASLSPLPPTSRRRARRAPTSRLLWCTTCLSAPPGPETQEYHRMCWFGLHNPCLEMENR